MMSVRMYNITLSKYAPKYYLLLPTPGELLHTTMTFLGNNKEGSILATAIGGS